MSTATPIPQLPATLTVGNLMSRAVIAMPADEPIAEAELEMRFAGIRHMPVVDAERRLMGVASLHDVAAAFARARKGQTIPIGAAMRTAVFTATPTTPLVEAITTLLENKLSCLPVVDTKHRLVGILTEADFLSFVHRAITGEAYARTF